MCVWVLRLASAFGFFFFFLAPMNSNPHYSCKRITQCTVHKVYNHFIQKKIIKNGSHSTIYTFKNYFAIVFLVFSKISCIQTDFVWQRLFLPAYFIIQFIFDTIYGSHRTISANFYFYLQYVQQKVFSFSKISGSQMDPKTVKNQIILLFFLL